MTMNATPSEPLLTTSPGRAVESAPPEEVTGPFGLPFDLRPWLPLLWLAGLLLLLLLGIAVLFRGGRRPPEATLTDDERQALLAELQQWLEQPAEEHAQAAD